MKKYNRTYSLRLASCMLSLSLGLVNLTGVMAHEKEEAVKKLESDLSGTQDFETKVNGKSHPLKRVSEVRNCRVTLKVFGEHGLLFQDSSDLTEDKPRVLFRKDKNHGYALTFGPLISGKPRPFYYFKTREERNAAFKKYQQLGKACREKSFKSFISDFRTQVKKANESLLAEKKNTCSLPYAEGENAGSMYNEEANNRMTLLINGEKAFIERFNAARNAKKSIYFQTLEFHGDETGWELADLLIQRKREGLDVKGMVDGMSNFASLEGNKSIIKNTMLMYNNLMAAGIRVFGYTCNPPSQLKTEVGKLTNLNKMNQRDHIKMFIADSDLSDDQMNTEEGDKSRKAIVGGMNIDNKYSRTYEKGKFVWRDQDAGIMGPIVKEMGQTFLRHFEAASIDYKGYDYDEKCFNPYDPITQKREYDIFLGSHYKNPVDNKGKFAVDGAVAKMNVEKLKEGKIFSNNDEKYEPNYVQSKASRFIANRPKLGETYLEDAHIELIDKAQEELIIENAFFVPTPRFREAMIRAAQRGVQVKVIVNSLETNGLPAITIMGRYHYKDLVDKSKPSAAHPNAKEMEIYEWDGREPDAKDGPLTQGTNHSKFMMIDGKYHLIGSHNLGRRSDVFNSESAIVFENAKLGEEMRAQFEKDKRNTKRITQDEIEYFHNPKGKGLFNDLKYKMNLWLAKKLENQF